MVSDTDGISALRRFPNFSPSVAVARVVRAVVRCTHGRRSVVHERAVVNVLRPRAAATDGEMNAIACGSSSNS